MCRGPSPTPRPRARSVRGRTDALGDLYAHGFHRLRHDPATASIVVTQATPTITWANPRASSMATALVCDPARRHRQRAGHLHLYAGRRHRACGPDDRPSRRPSHPPIPRILRAPSATATIVVSPVAPTITWANPAGIVYGGGAILSTAARRHRRRSRYASLLPPLSTVLGRGTQTLSATFTPTDATDYTKATTSVTIIVAKAMPTLAWANPSSIVLRHGAVRNPARRHG